MPKCREKQIIEDPFEGVAALGCDLDEGHTESYHEDRLQQTRWMRMEDEQPAMVASLPIPPPKEITERKNVRAKDVGHAGRAEIASDPLFSGLLSDS